MSYYFGLYFGNTNLSMAVCKDAKTEVLANAAGDRVTPAFVSFANGEKLVGLAAKQGMVRNPGNTITHVKSFLGGNEAAINECKCKVIDDNGFKYEINLDGKITHYTPFEALISLFENMAVIAKSHCHEADIPVVVTVPLCFTNKQRETVKLSAIKAGFRLLRVISEPAAAALAYDIGQEEPDKPSKCIIYRMGATSVDVTIIQIVGGVYHVVTSVKKEKFGGNVFTEQLVDFCAGEFKRQYKVDVRDNKRSVIKLHSAAETCKHILSSIGSAQCFAESVYEGIDLSINVSRARFESLINNVLQHCLEPVREVLESAHLSVNEVDKLVLVGGSCKIPKLQQVLADMFPSTTMLTSISPDEVIAIGAAKEAILVQEEELLTEKDCYINALSHEIYAKIFSEDEITTVLLFPQGTPIPASHCESVNSGCPVGHLDIYEQISDSINNRKENRLAKLPAPLATTKNLTLSAHLSKDGILQVSCSDNASHLKRTVTIMPKSD